MAESVYWRDRAGLTGRTWGFARNHKGSHRVPGWSHHYVGTRQAAEHLADCSRRDVPKNACYWAHCGKAYVWVCPEGMERFSHFVLVCQKIARIDVGRGRT
jgi:hypothetical protein